MWDLRTTECVQVPNSSISSGFSNKHWHQNIETLKQTLVIETLKYSMTTNVQIKLLKNSMTPPFSEVWHCRECETPMWSRPQSLSEVRFKNPRIISSVGQVLYCCAQLPRASAAHLSHWFSFQRGKQITTKLFWLVAVSKWNIARAFRLAFKSFPLL